jgi:hypothetical protein
VKQARPQRRAGDLSTWGSVRRWEADTRLQLRNRHALWLHGWCIGGLVLGTMWGATHLQMLLGFHSLALRYLVTLGLGYGVFLLALRWWAGRLAGEQVEAAGVADVVDAVDALEPAADLAADALSSVDLSRVAASIPMRSGGGGDFGGGGASADFGSVLDAASSVGDVAGDVGGDLAGDLAGEVAGGALEAVASSDDAAVVVVPVVVVFLIGVAIVLGAGSLVLLFFGSEVLLAVAVELAFGYVSARTAVRVVREGWLEAAVRLTWKPLLGTLVCAIVIGGLVDYFVPQARSLPHAIKLLIP